MRTSVSCLLVGLCLSACGGFPDGEWDDLTAQPDPEFCPTDEEECPPGFPASVIVEADAGAARETLMMEPAQTSIRRSER